MKTGKKTIIIQWPFNLHLNTSSVCNIKFNQFIYDIKKEKKNT